MKKYKGTIVQESLTDDRILNDFIFLDFRVTKDKNPNDRWHLFTVQASEKLVIKLAKYLKSEKWYAHFWNKNDVIAIFPGKRKYARGVSCLL